MTQCTTNHGSHLHTQPGTRTGTRQIQRVTQERRTSTLRKQSSWCCWATIVLLIGTARSMPQSFSSPQDATPPSLTDQLLKDAPSQTSRATIEVPPSPRLSQSPTMAGSDIGENNALLVRVGQRMQAVAARLNPGTSFHKTQQMQKDILADLDELLRQTGPNLQGPGKTPPNQGDPPATSRREQLPDNGQTKSSSRGSALLPDPNATASASRGVRQKQLWGSLPKQIRSRLRNISNEQVLPKYQILVDAYYERLSTATQDATNPETTDR